MSSESMCQVARSWVDVGGFPTRLFIIFIIFTSSVRNILDISLCVAHSVFLVIIIIIIVIIMSVCYDDYYNQN
jgi:hypothetical protein